MGLPGDLKCVLCGTVGTIYTMQLINTEGVVIGNPSGLAQRADVQTTCLWEQPVKGVTQNSS